LYDRAIGYLHKAEKIFCTKDGEIVRAEYIEHHPPDERAASLWLRNRQPQAGRVRVRRMISTIGAHDAHRSLAQRISHLSITPVGTHREPGSPIKPDRGSSASPVAPGPTYLSRIRATAEVSHA